MISDWIFPPDDLATTTLLGGWAGFRRARVRARYELGLLQGSRTTTALSGVGPGPKELEQEHGGCWISPRCASPLHDDWGYSWGLRSWDCTFVPVLLFPRGTIVVRHQVRTEGAGVTLPSCLHMFPSLHVDAHTCSDEGHPRVDSTPSQSDTDSSSDTICLLSGQRQGQGPSQFHSFQICTVFLAMAAFLSGGKQEMLEQEPIGAGSHAQVVLASWPEQEGIFNTGSTVFPGGSKTVPTLWEQILGFLQPSRKPLWFSNQLRGLSSRCQIPWLLCLGCVLNPSVPGKTLWAYDTPMFFASPTRSSDPN